MTNDLGARYGEHRRAHSQTSCDSPGSSDSSDNGTQPLLITGNKTRDTALAEPRIRAGEIVGWRIWKLCNGLLDSVFVIYTWRPGVFERSSCKHRGYDKLGCYENFGYHAFKDKEQAEREASMYTHWWPCVIGSVAMWGEVIEHEHGWRSEYAAVRTIIKISGDIGSWCKQRSLLDLGKKYGCSVVTDL
jgi:hypothetical protein